jgi:transcriptional regulator with XRE-family HTH domain
MENAFGTFIRNRREELREKDREFSVRKVAARIGVEPSYLSKVERGEQPPPSEAKIVALAEVLDEDPDILLAMAGKVSSDLQEVIRKSDLQEVIRKRPKLFADLIRQLRTAPDRAVLRLVREVRDGDW